MKVQGSMQWLHTGKAELEEVKALSCSPTLQWLLLEDWADQHRCGWASGR